MIQGSYGNQYPKAMLSPLQTSLCALIRSATYGAKDPVQVVMDLVESRITFRGTPRFSTRFSKGEGWSEVAIQEGVDPVLYVYILSDPDKPTPRFRGASLILTEFSDWDKVKRGTRPVFYLHDPPPQVNQRLIIQRLSAFSDLRSAWTPGDLRLRRVCSAVTQVYASGDHWEPCDPKRTSCPNGWKRYWVETRLRSKGVVLQGMEWFFGSSCRVLTLDTSEGRFQFLFFTEGAVLDEKLRRYLVSASHGTTLFLISHREPANEDPHWHTKEEWSRLGVSALYGPPDLLGFSSVFYPFEATILQPLPPDEKAPEVRKGLDDFFNHQGFNPWRSTLDDGISL